MDNVTKNFQFQPVWHSLEYITAIKSNAGGVDSIIGGLIELSLEATLPSITHFIYSCLIDGVYPLTWKTALTTST